MQSLKQVLENVTLQQICSAPHVAQTMSQQKTISSSSSDIYKAEKRIDLLFSKFAAFYGHIWRSQFKDERFLEFAKKEWQDALSEFTDAVLTKAIVNCREFHELPPTLPQVLQCCRKVKKQGSFCVVNSENGSVSKEIMASHLKRCKEILAR